MESHGDAKLTDLLYTLADCPKANSAGIHDRCKAVYGPAAAARKGQEHGQEARVRAGRRWRAKAEDWPAKVIPDGRKTKEYNRDRDMP
jgi:hypothetical protein